MQSVVRWESIWLNIFLGIFVWQLFDTLIDYYKISIVNQLKIYIIGSIISIILIYRDRHFN